MKNLLLALLLIPNFLNIAIAAVEADKYCAETLRGAGAFRCSEYLGPGGTMRLTVVKSEHKSSARRTVSSMNAILNYKASYCDHSKTISLYEDDVIIDVSCVFKNNLQ